MVSYRAKKKLADRTCMYCGKEFRYPCRLKQHYKTVKCSDSVSSQMTDQTVFGQCFISDQSVFGQCFISDQSVFGQCFITDQSMFGQ
jgi:hypothetical protein